MTQPAKAQEPSMEEILASIRRIIADDDPKAADPVALAEAPRAVAPPRVEPLHAETRSEPSRESGRRSLADLPPARSETSRSETSRADARQTQAVSAQPNSTQQEMDAMLANLDDEIVAPLPPGKSAATEVLELTESMAMTPVVAPKASAKTGAFRTIEPQNDVEFSELAEAPVPEAPPPREAAPRPRPVAREASREAARDYAPAPEPVREPELPQQPPLLSGSTMAAVDSAFNALTHTVFAQNARTLEDLVKEMLRPMLKSWLDDNLPEVVERIVRAEIERVSRGR